MTPFQDGFLFGLITGIVLSILVALLRRTGDQS